MARQPRLDRNRRGFGVANFTDQNDLRVLTHDAPERYGIAESLRRINLRLADHRQIEFDRVFDRADADAGTISLHDVAKRRIHRAGLARAGRAGEQQQPAGALEHAHQPLQRRIFEAKRT